MQFSISLLHFFLHYRSRVICRICTKQKPGTNTIRSIVQINCVMCVYLYNVNLTCFYTISFYLSFRFTQLSRTRVAIAYIKSIPTGFTIQSKLYDEISFIIFVNLLTFHDQERLLVKKTLNIKYVPHLYIRGVKCVVCV